MRKQLDAYQPHFDWPFVTHQGHWGRPFLRVRSVGLTPTLRTCSCRELVKQCFGFFEDRRLESFGEPVVDRRE
jgi:hypothetical protein